MGWSRVRRRRWYEESLALAALATGLVLAVPVRAATESITVVLDHAMLIKLPEKVATLVVGNPMIADVTLQAGGVMVVTGKGYGITNLLALDRSGTVLMEKSVRVRAPGDSVIVYRGTERESYSCAPQCERRLMLGDSQTAFQQVLGETNARNAQAQAAAR